jgi:flagellar basal-body rod modification protein FlgD
MDINTATVAANTPSAGKPAVGDALIESDFQTFLLMLTTQMQNQDPLNPIESSDYAVQLATFSGVEQQVRTNQLIETLASQMGLSGMGQMAGWVGMEALVAAPVQFSGSPITLTPAPAAGADGTVLVTLDGQNREIQRTTVPVSSDPVDWAGTDASGAPLPPGTYNFRLESYAAGQLIATDPVASYARVTEVRAGTNGPIVVTSGGIESAASAVSALRAASG